MSVVDSIVSALSEKTGFDVVEKTDSSSQLRLLGRVAQASMPAWLELMEKVLGVADGAQWKADVSKVYLLKGGKLVYAWRVIFQSSDIENHHGAILNAIRGTTEAPGELLEVPLFGYSSTRFMDPDKSRRGARPLGGR